MWGNLSWRWLARNVGPEIGSQGRHCYPSSKWGLEQEKGKTLWRYCDSNQHGLLQPHWLLPSSNRTSHLTELFRSHINASNNRIRMQAGHMHVMQFLLTDLKLSHKGKKKVLWPAILGIPGEKEQLEMSRKKPALDGSVWRFHMLALWKRAAVKQPRILCQKGKIASQRMGDENPHLCNHSLNNWG